MPIERLNESSEFWGIFDAAQYPYEAIFGHNATTPFRSIQEVRHKVGLSARMLIDTIRDGERSELAAEWKANIGWDFNGDDQLGRMVDDAVDAIEKTCRPAIIGDRREKP